MEISRPETPEPQILLAEEISTVRSVLGSGYTDIDIIRALNASGNNPNHAINALLDSPKLAVCSQPVRSNASMSSFRSSKENLDFNLDKLIFNAKIKVQEEKSDFGSQQNHDLPNVKQETSMSSGKVDSATPLPDETFEEYMERRNNADKKERKAREDSNDTLQNLTTSNPLPYLNPHPIRAIKPPDCVVSDRRLQVLPNLNEPELGNFPEEHDWFLVGKTYVAGLSTCRGKKLLDAGEIVHFAFPSSDRDFGGVRVRPKTAAAMSAIVRFSTKRSGEIGKLPPEWTRCLVPLVNSSKVKVRGSCVYSTANLSLMQEVLLYMGFYIHSSIFTECNKDASNLTPSLVDSTVNPLATLFDMLKIKPTKGAEFTPRELNSRKRSIHLRDDMYDLEQPSQRAGSSKKQKAGEGESYTDLDKDEQAISEASLNKLVGTADHYNLAEAQPPSTLLCELKPYQKQALYWMSGLEQGVTVEKTSKTLHPCWSAYKFIDQRAPTVYVNVFSGETTTQFPSATQKTRGGILADAMGLGKTVMTIALVLSNPRGGNLEFCDSDSDDSGTYIKGGTLIVCPMALLGQWKDEIEAHAKSGSLSVFIHYGGDRTTDPRILTRHHVVLTTYGVLTSAYKPGSEQNSIFHKVNWYRVVLDEAHTIKSSKTKVAQAAFALSSHCRWCLTGTPLQNNLEDLYSLLCFLHIKPWCNWDWWTKLIQRPYENGDERGLNLVRAILRPLMLRRTKETRDKEGRPILVLPPVNMQVVECEPSEAERDFYQALFRRSQVKFDQFVSQGKVLHNYASILELLLRLRQCCNHPFLVMSRTQEYTDLDKLARRFLDSSQTNSSNGPTPAYVEEVVENLRQGVVTECPICLESTSDDPVLTPCAHRLCRECLLASWQGLSGGPCPICRHVLTKSDLITCPLESRFQVDVENQWKESCKVTKLIRCLGEVLRKGEKSIVFSQWTGFMDLLEIALKRKNIGFLRFDGKLLQKQRERVLKEFSESKDKLVLLMSLKAGGVGLNLTAASNVFLMDPWWNPAVEEQAIMRIHRIGQKQQVQVRRFIVKDTVEERMQQVQAKKQRMISGALTDDEVRTTRMEELKMLFR